MNDDIDFVITWVDGSDKKWQAEKEKYEKNVNLNKCDSRSSRYRDMNLLKYLFRGIDKYAPWVHKVYFITYGHIPKWLDTNNPKLVIVNHKDYIPKEYLPTFNSNVIENIMYKIDGLSNQFVYFNDDMFILKKVKKTDFFKYNKPCDTMILRPVFANRARDVSEYYRKINNDMAIINKNFRLRSCLKKNIFKYINLKQGKYFFENILFLHFKQFVGFYNSHCPVSYLKSTFEEVWNKESDILNLTMTYKFRNNTESVNHWLFRYWQFATGNFVQRHRNFCKYLTIRNNKIENIIKKRKYNMICLNDSSNCLNYEERIKEIASSFEQILNDKCSFEK